MALTTFSASAPVFEQMLGALHAVLDKAAAHCAARKIDEAVMTSTRLIPDMLPLSRQVQIACDHAARATARLTGAELPKFEDVEKTIPELQARIDKALAYVRAADPAKVAAGAETKIAFPIGPTKAEMKGDDYLLHFSLPNFFFHVTTAYAILRTSGVDVGKRDYMGAVPNLTLL